MHKNCEKYHVFLSFAEFEAFSLFGDGFSFSLASESLLAFVAELQPGAWKPPVTFIICWCARQALLSRLAMLGAYRLTFCGPSLGLFLSLKIQTTLEIF